MSTDNPQSSSRSTSGIGRKVYPMRIAGALAIAITVFLGTGIEGLRLAHGIFFAFALLYPHVAQLLMIRFDTGRRVQTAAVSVDAFVIGMGIYFVGAAPVPTLSFLTVALANGMALGSVVLMTAAALGVLVAVSGSRIFIGPLPPPRDLVEMNLTAALFLLLYFIYFAWVAYHRSVALQSSRIALRQQKVAAEIEKSKSARLLLAILPEHAAREYEAKGSVSPVLLPEATILVVDACGFGEFAHRVGAVEAIGSLNILFKAFDAICRRHALEPLRTMGDAYMALATPPGSSASAALAAATEMRRHAAAVSRERQARGEEAVPMRFALHTGEVLAVVIETEKFSYDLFGETMAHALEVARLALPDSVAVSASLLGALAAPPPTRPVGVIRSRRSDTTIGVSLVETESA